jgi:hypothetical protein
MVPTHTRWFFLLEWYSHLHSLHKEEVHREWLLSSLIGALGMVWNGVQATAHTYYELDFLRFLRDGRLSLTTIRSLTSHNFKAIRVKSCVLISVPVAHLSKLHLPTSDYIFALVVGNI